MSPREKANTERVNVFFSADVLEKLKTDAREKGTTVSGLIRMIVLSYLQESEQEKTQLNT